MSYGEVALLAPLICVYVCVKRLIVRPGESVIRLTFVLIPTSIWYHHSCDQGYHRTRVMSFPYIPVNMGKQVGTLSHDKHFWKMS